MSFVAAAVAVGILVGVLIAGILGIPAVKTAQGLTTGSPAVVNGFLRIIEMGIATLFPLALFLSISAYILGRTGRYEEGLAGRLGYVGYVLGQFVFFLITPSWWSII